MAASNESSLPEYIPVTKLIENPTVELLASALEHIGSSNGTSSIQVPMRFDPVVTFRKDGGKPPLWLIHSAVGEVLDYHNFTKYFTD